METGVATIGIGAIHQSVLLPIVPTEPWTLILLINSSLYFEINKIQYSFYL